MQDLSKIFFVITIKKQVTGASDLFTSTLYTSCLALDQFSFEVQGTGSYRGECTENRIFGESQSLDT